MTRTEELDKVLSGLLASSGYIEACAVVSEDGLIIASSLSQGLEEINISAVSATVLSIGSRVAAEMKRGDLQQLFVKGEEGYVIITHAGPNAALMIIVRKEAKLGLIFFELSRATEEVEEIML